MDQLDQHPMSGGGIYEYAKQAIRDGHCPMFKLELTLDESGELAVGHSLCGDHTVFAAMVIKLFEEAIGFNDSGALSASGFLLHMATIYMRMAFQQPIDNHPAIDHIKQGIEANMHGLDTIKVFTHMKKDATAKRNLYPNGDFPERPNMKSIDGQKYYTIETGIVGMLDVAFPPVSRN